jgi:hypothetical protein
MACGCTIVLCIMFFYKLHYVRYKTYFSFNPFQCVYESGFKCVVV